LCSLRPKNPFLGEKFELIIESNHFADAGVQENALGMDAKMLKGRDTVLLDLATEKIDPKDYKKETDPHLYHSEKTGRGPLQAGWVVSQISSCCCFLFF